MCNIEYTLGIEVRSELKTKLNKDCKQSLQETHAQCHHLLEIFYPDLFYYD